MRISVLISPALAVLGVMITSAHGAMAMPSGVNVPPSTGINSFEKVGYYGGYDRDCYRSYYGRDDYQNYYRPYRYNNRYDYYRYNRYDYPDRYYSRRYRRYDRGYYNY